MSSYQHQQQPQHRSHHQQKYCYVFVTVLLLVGLFLHAWYLQPLAFPLDDAYLVLHNAQVLHWGFDPNFVGVGALEGTTSSVHLALVTLLMFGLSPLWASETLAWVAIIIYAMGLLRLAFVFSASIWQALLIVLLGLTIGFMPFQLLNGLETGLAMAMLVWVLVLFASTQTKFAHLVGNVLLGLLPFVRPELAIFTGLMLLWQAWRYWLQQRSYQYLSLHILLDGLVVLLSATPWLLWYWLNTGAVYPHSMVAKETFMGLSHLPFHMKWTMLIYIVANFAYLVSWLGCIGMCVLLLMTPLGRVGLLFILGFLALYGFLYPTGLYVNVQRYLYICLPFLLYGAITGMRYPDKAIRYLAYLAIMVTLAQSLWNLPYRWHFYLTQREIYSAASVSAAIWCQTHLPANATVLVHDAGYIAFATHFHLIDLVGLKTPSNIYYHEQFTVPSAGRQRVLAISAIIKHSHPQYFIVLAEWNKNLNLITGLQTVGWQMQLLHPSVTGYAVYKIGK